MYEQAIWFLMNVSIAFSVVFLDPSGPYGPGRDSGVYVNSQPFDGRSGTPLTIVLDGNQREQRVPLQVLVRNHKTFFFLHKSKKLGCI